MTTITRTSIIPGYQITELIYSSDRTSVYRAIRERDGLAVVVKILTYEYPTFNELLQFRNQYTIAKNLDSDGVVRSLALESYGNGYAIVMEDFGGISLNEYIESTTLSLTEFLQLAIQVTNILHYLYQNRVIHKDIKPANILIHPDTKKLKLIDFSIASLLPKETQEIKSPNVLEGTLAYISPEQTGRMNRGIDYRSDFYSLGVTFYELLAKQLPFISNEAMKLVHCHIAKIPLALAKRGEVPQVISDIVSKLMAKNAEERYQSALGLKSDLESCLYQLENTGEIAHFEIGKRDLCDKFIIPEKLYGRTEEVQALLAAFQRVSGEGNNSNPSRSEMMLVAGFSGIGKTVVVSEVHKPIVKQCGYFIKGKFDQFNRNIPFSAFVQAFRDLIEQLLSESDAQLSNWKDKILAALGDSGQVIIDVIPELENIIGQQPVVPELTGNAAQNRFNLLLQKFLQVFTTPEHPLVLFLDDLQWADSASLKLIKLLMSEDNKGYLLLIGAYRDNEVFPAHPLMLTLDEISKNGAFLNTITLQTLSQNSLNQLVADTLKCNVEYSQIVAQLVYQKTQGNPFFSNQFLKALHEDKLINFDLDAGYWQCDISKIKETALTDDVVEFMALQLQKLPEATQNILKLAACIGNHFDLSTLAIISQQPPSETASALWKALQEGLILPQSQVYKFYVELEQQANQEKVSQSVSYKFLHDRVQQAAYSLIPDDQKQLTHYRIGQLLLQKIPKENKEERIFEIVNQLNYGITFIAEQSLRNNFAELNLIACRKAKIATAYQAAIEYAKVGLPLLGETAWETQYEMTLSFHELTAELTMLCGDFEEMKQYVDIVIERAKSLLEKVNVYRVRIQANISQNKLNHSIEIALEILENLGVTFPQEPTQADIQQAVVKVGQLIGDRNIEDLLDQNMMVDRSQIAIIQIASSILGVAYLSGSPLFPLLVSLCVELSVIYGNTQLSALSYVSYGIILCDILQDIDTASQFGNLALNVASKLDAKATKPEILNVLGAFILHRKSHLKETLPLLQEGYVTALEVGNLEYTGYHANDFCINSFWCGQLVATLEQDAGNYYNALIQLNQSTTANYCSLHWQLALNLLNLVEHPTILTGTAFQEDKFLPLFLSADDKQGLCAFYLYKLMLCFLFGEIEQAQNNAVEAKRYLVGGLGTCVEPVFYFYDSLMTLASQTVESETLERVEQNQTQLQKYWVHYAPMNHQHKFDLVEAEKYRVSGNIVLAIELYDKAILGAKVNGYIQEEALAHELAAKFYLGWGKEKVAASYMQEAYYCYARWGAKAKTNDLQKGYPRLLQPIFSQQRINANSLETISTSIISTSNKTLTTGSTTVSDILDFASILKAARTISSSIELDGLIINLNKIILENSGAKKAVLILPEEKTWQVRAITLINRERKELGELENILVADAIDTCDYVPQKIIYYVKNTKETVIINNSQTNIPGLIGEYMLQHRPKSLLCTPIINQGNLVGILYLENKITAAVFTQERLQVINLLSSQAAVSLENARLYQQAQQALQDLQQAQLQIVQSEKMSALGNLVAGVAHEMNNPLGFISATLKQTKPAFDDIHEHLKICYANLPNSCEPVTEHAEDIELDYTLEDFPKMLDTMLMACDRLKHISTSLRTFSRADKDYKVLFNIHLGIDSTILILKHRLKANEQRPAIDVIREYGDVQQIECFPGQLNQVFMNILANAIDALEEFNVGRSFKEIEANPNKIIVRTSVDNNHLRIAITDNAMGMSDEIKAKIFDHLFTTKAVGKGTGLGLAIVKQIIVEQHGGRVEVNSTLGQGTEFVIFISMKSENF